MAKYKGVAPALDNPRIGDEQKQDLIENGFVTSREARIRRELRARGWLLMHRRGGKYWMVHEDTMTLDMLEGYLKAIDEGRAEVPWVIQT